jgi:bacteriorhodopsin
MTSLEVTLHWLYVAIMFGSALAFFAWSRQPRHVPEHKYLIHILIVIWSGLVYSAIAQGQGHFEWLGEKVVFARYLDWVISTPLLVLALSFTAMLRLTKVYWLKTALVFVQVVMILTGLVAELVPDEYKWYWYAMGCVALVIQLYLFWKPLYAIARSQDLPIQNAYRKSAIYLTVQWLLYPLVWALGSMGLRVFGTELTSILYIILPIVSKAGFGFFNLNLLRKLPPPANQRTN